MPDRVDNAALASSAGRFDPMRANAASGSAVIDPVTALPAQAVLGATVCAPSCVIADALTKIVMNAGDDSCRVPAKDRYQGKRALCSGGHGEMPGYAGLADTPSALQLDPRFRWTLYAAFSTAVHYRRRLAGCRIRLKDLRTEKSGRRCPHICS